MASTYSLIASQVLSGSASSVTFSSIPQTYTDLVLKVSARATSGSFVMDYLDIRFNGDSATNYSATYLSGDGASASSSGTNGLTYSRHRYTADGNAATANTFGNAEIYIPNYTVSTNKPVASFGVSENNATTAYLASNATLWLNTAAITSIVLVLNLGTSFAAGSSFYLYGIKNS